MVQFPLSDWIPPEDPIFGVMAAFRQDSRPNKVNLVVGAYRTAAGEPFVLPSVRAAEQALLDNKKINKEYLPIDGDADFCGLTGGLIFGELIGEIRSRTVGAQMVGGTGALRIAGEYLALAGARTIYVSNPSWANHKGVFARCGLKIESYPYYDIAKQSIDFDGLCQAIQKMNAGSTILLHGCCHNPTGVDLSQEQWKRLSLLIMKQGVIPFFDLAYQGFGDGLDPDAWAVRHFAEQGHELLVAYSFAKNFGLYSERVGFLAIVTANQQAAAVVGKQIKTLIRGNYSNPPSHGSRIVTTILQSESLKQMWITELENMRQRVVEMRQTLAKGLQQKGIKNNYDTLITQKGLFSYGVIPPSYVPALREEFAIYMPDDGRLNVAGLNSSNVPYILNAIDFVSKKNKY